MDIKKNNEYDELINRYLNGEMNESEKSEFLTSLEKDVAFRERAQMLGIIAKEIQQINSENVVKSAIEQSNEVDFAQKVKQLRNKKHAGDDAKGDCAEDGTCSITTPTIGKKRISRRWYYSMAAGILAIIGLFTIYQKFSSPNLVDFANKQDIYMITYSRTAEDSLMVVDLNSSFEVIKNGKDVHVAVNKLTELLANANDNPTIANHRIEIVWNLAVAYLKLDDKENATKSLEEIVSSAEDTPLANKAKQLINEIK